MTMYRTLPYRVLDDLRTAGFIDAEGVTALLDAGYTHEAIYPVVKACDDDPRAQERLLARLMSVLQEYDEHALGEFLRAEAAYLGAPDIGVRERNLARAIRGDLTRESVSVRVRVAQLIQWNRLDRDEWRARVRGAVWSCHRREIAPVLVSYAALVALPEIMRRIGDCYVLNPGWISDPANHWCGLILSTTYTRAVLIGKDEELTATPLWIVDDTIRTGKTLMDVRRYLAARGNPEVTPYILWDARGAGYAPPFPVDGSAVLEWTWQEVEGAS